MLLTLLLGGIFVASAFALWYRISEKIPELVAIHDTIITQRLHEDSAKLRLFLLYFKTFYKEEYYLNIFWNFLGKMCYRAHIAVLRIDNGLVGFLKKIRARGGFAGLSTSEMLLQQQAKEVLGKDEVSGDSYWSALKKQHSGEHPSPVVSRRRHVEGVRPARIRRTPVKSKLSDE